MTFVALAIVGASVVSDPCKNGNYFKCHNKKTVYEDYEKETIECKVCGLRYSLYDDEMR